MSVEAEKIRTTIIYAAAVIAFLVGIGLCIAGFIVPPQGRIDGTVLTATGEFLTFFGSVFGIGEYSRIKIEQIKAAADKRKAADDSED